MIKINENACIGCGACVSTVPEVFDFNDEGYATIKKEVTEESIKNLKEDIVDAIEGCPTSAISKD